MDDGQTAGGAGANRLRIQDAADDRERPNEANVLVDAVVVAVAIGLLLSALIVLAGLTLV